MAEPGFMLQSPRLILREFKASDAPDLYDLYRDEDVMRYTAEAPFPSVKSVEDFLEAYPYYDIHGFGRWAVIDRFSSECLGFCGLRKDNPTTEVDLGFRFFRRYWSKGFATEAAQAALEAGFTHFGLEEIIGRSMRENLASTSVLHKLGMRFREVTETDGVLWLIYVIDKASHETRIT